MDNYFNKHMFFKKGKNMISNNI